MIWRSDFTAYPLKFLVFAGARNVAWETSSMVWKVGRPGHCHVQACHFFLKNKYDSPRNKTCWFFPRKRVVTCSVCSSKGGFGKGQDLCVSCRLYLGLQRRFGRFRHLAQPNSSDSVGKGSHWLWQGKSTERVWLSQPLPCLDPGLRCREQVRRDGGDVGWDGQEADENPFNSFDETIKNLRRYLRLYSWPHHVIQHFRWTSGMEETCKALLFLLSRESTWIRMVKLAGTLMKKPSNYFGSHHIIDFCDLSGRTPLFQVSAVWFPVKAKNHLWPRSETEAFFYLRKNHQRQVPWKPPVWEEDVDIAGRGDLRLRGERQSSHLPALVPGGHPAAEVPPAWLWPKTRSFLKKTGGKAQITLKRWKEWRIWLQVATQDIQPHLCDKAFRPCLMCCRPMLCANPDLRVGVPEAFSREGLPCLWSGSRTSYILYYKLDVFT